MSQEIALHRNISHENVVAFHSFFEDKDFVYVVLELCRRRVRNFNEYFVLWCLIIAVNEYETDSRVL